MSGHTGAQAMETSVQVGKKKKTQGRLLHQCLTHSLQGIHAQDIHLQDYDPQDMNRQHGTEQTDSGMRTNKKQKQNKQSKQGQPQQIDNNTTTMKKKVEQKAKGTKDQEKTTFKQHILCIDPHHTTK